MGNASVMSGNLFPILTRVFGTFGNVLRNIHEWLPNIPDCPKVLPDTSEVWEASGKHFGMIPQHDEIHPTPCEGLSEH